MVLAFRSDIRKELSNCNWKKKEDLDNFLLILTELGTNLVSHANGGILEVWITDPPHPSVIVRAFSLKTEVLKLRNTHHTLSSLGIGLLSARDLMDEVTINDKKQYFEVICKKYLKI